MEYELGRGCRADSALAWLWWASGRQALFTVHDAAAEMGCDKRTAYRWFDSLESLQLIESVDERSVGGPTCRFRSRFRIALESGSVDDGGLAAGDPVDRKYGS